MRITIFTFSSDVEQDTYMFGLHERPMHRLLEHIIKILKADQAKIRIQPYFKLNT